MSLYFLLLECDPLLRNMYWFPEDCLDYETGDMEKCDYIASWEYLRYLKHAFLTCPYFIFCG